MRAALMLALLSATGCTLLRDADDVLIGPGADAASDTEVIDTSPPIDSDVMDSPPPMDSVVMEDHRWALWRMPSNTPTGYTSSAEVVRDSVTGLVWQRAAVAGTSYDAADAACAALTLEGKGGFRLPTRIELISLLAIARGQRPAILATAFPGTPPAPFWTSSTRATGGRYVVDFGDATVKSALGTESYAYRCVRAP